MSRNATAFGLSLVALTTLTGATQAAPNILAYRIRQVDARFQNVAEALKEGYTPIPCASGEKGGSMGVHYVNVALLKAGTINIRHPQAVMYEPEYDGTMALVAVEYITFNGPASLEGQLFNYNSAPNRYGIGPFYDLHVWAWRSNPTGTFSEMNPNVSCNAMPVTASYRQAGPQ